MITWADSLISYLCMSSFWPACRHADDAAGSVTTSPGVADIVAHGVNNRRTSAPGGHALRTSAPLPPPLGWTSVEGISGGRGREWATAQLE